MTELVKYTKTIFFCIKLANIGTKRKGVFSVSLRDTRKIIHKLFVQVYICMYMSRLKIDIAAVLLLLDGQLSLLLESGLSVYTLTY